MSHTQRFTITPEHVKLARSMWVGWDYVEFGAPAVDSKRPYGNGDVLSDMREILERPDATDKELLKLHEDMQRVIQITLRTGTMAPGDYEAPRYGVNWQKVG